MRLNVRHRSIMRVFLSTLVCCFVSALLAQDAAGFSVVTSRPVTGGSTVPVAKSKALAVGDRIPYDLSFTMVNGPKRHVKLSDFKDKKLIILDFWATWCGSCISKFPKLDSLQQVYQDEVQIILVNSTNTGDNEEKIRNFFLKRRNKDGQAYRLHSSVADTEADQFFPHKTVPHYAWLGASGEVKAITASKEVTAANIQAMLAGNKVDLLLKKDFFPNRLLDLGGGEDRIIVDENMERYSVFRKGKLEGLKKVNQLRLVRNAKGLYIRGKAMRNVSLLEMYKAAINFNKEFRNVFNDKRLIWEVSDPSKLTFKPGGSTAIESWEETNLYSYDLVIPASEADSLYAYMIRDIDHYSGYRGRIEKRITRCLVLIKTGETDKLKTKGGRPEYRLHSNASQSYIYNLPVRRLVSGLERELAALPVVDETGYAGNIDIELPVDLENREALRKALQEYGLDLKEMEKELDVFVISEK